MTCLQNIPYDLTERDQFVVVRTGSKVPLTPMSGNAASSSDAMTWSDFGTACDALEMGMAQWLGFVFDNPYSKEIGIVGIDIDCGFDESGELSDVSKDILGKTCTYTEVSRSGRGFHLLVKGRLPFAGKNNRNGVEIYRDGRYFILTGELYDNRMNILYDQNLIDSVVKTYFKEEKTSKKKGVHTPIYTPKYEGYTEKGLSLKAVYPPVPEGSRHLSILSIAGQLRSIGMDAENILKRLVKVNHLACTPPLPDAELRSIAWSVARYE